VHKEKCEWITTSLSKLALNSALLARDEDKADSTSALSKNVTIKYAALGEAK